MTKNKGLFKRIVTAVIVLTAILIPANARLIFAEETPETTPNNRYTDNTAVLEYTFNNEEDPLIGRQPTSYRIDERILPSVRDQGNLGVGWAHAAIASLESNILFTGEAAPGDTAANLDLSESHLINYAKMIKAPSGDTSDCITYKPELTREDIFNFGGSAEIAAHTMSNWIGTVSETGNTTKSIPDYKYAKILDQSFADYPSERENRYVLDEVYVVPLKKRNTIKYMIKKYGAAYVNLDFNSTYYCSDGSNGYYYNGDSAATKGNHAVAIVGWDDGIDLNKFHAKGSPDGAGAYIVRNSMGSSFGNNGYFYVSYEDKSLSDAKFSNAYFFIGKKVPDMKYKEGMTASIGSENPELNLYSYDRGNNPTGSIETSRIAQLFKADSNKGSVVNASGVRKDGAEVIDGIMLYSYYDNVPYRLQVYRLNVANIGDAENPIDGAELLDEEKTGTLHAGYNRITTYECDSAGKIISGEPVYAKEGEVLSYVVTFGTAGAERVVKIGADISNDYNIEKKGINYVTTNEDRPKPGETFINVGGELCPITDTTVNTSSPWEKIITKDVREIPFINMALRLQDSEISLTRGESKKIEYSFKYADPDAKITFSSSNTDIATVDATGRITAKELGACEITVSYTTKDINGIYDSNPHEYKIKVNVFKYITSMDIKCFDKETGDEITMDSDGRHVIGTKQEVVFKVYDQDGDIIPATAFDTFKSEYKGDFTVDGSLNGKFTPYFQQVGWEETERKGDIYLEKMERITAIVGINISHTETQIAPAYFDFYARNDFDKVNEVAIKIYKVNDDGTRGTEILPEDTPDSNGNKVFHVNMSEKVMIVPVNADDDTEISLDDIVTDSVTTKVFTVNSACVGNFTDFARRSVWEDESLEKGDPCPDKTADVRAIMDKSVAHSKNHLLTHIKIVPVNDVDRIRDGVVVINVGDDAGGRTPYHSDPSIAANYEADIVVGIDDGDVLNDKRSIIEVFTKDTDVDENGDSIVVKGTKIPEEYIRLAVAPLGDYEIENEMNDLGITKSMGAFPLSMQKKIWRACPAGGVYDAEEIAITAIIDKEYAHTRRNVEIPVKLTFKGKNDIKVVSRIAVGCTKIDEAVPQWAPEGSTSKVGVIGIYDKDEHLFFAYDADDPAKTPITKGISFTVIPKDGYKISSDSKHKGEYTAQLLNSVVRQCSPGEVYENPVRVIATLKADNAHTASDVKSDDYIFYPYNDINTYDIEFYNGGFLYDSQVVAEGSPVTVPISPDIEGYTFLGWDLEPTDLTKTIKPYDFETKIVEGLDILEYDAATERYKLKLYAKWSTRSDYLITVDKCYGLIAIGDELTVNAKLSFETGEEVSSNYYIKMTVPAEYGDIISIETNDEDELRTELEGKIKGLKIGNSEVIVTAYEKSAVAGVPDRAVASVRIAKVIVEVYTQQAITIGDGYTVPVDGAQIKSVNDYAKKPDVKINSPEFNIFYKNPRAEIVVKTKTEFKLEKIELSANYNFKYVVIREGDKIYLKGKPGYEVRREDSGEKGKLSFYYEGFTDPVVVQTTVKVKNTGPRITQKGTPTLSPVYTNLVKFNLVEGTEPFDFSDIVEKSDTTTFDGLRIDVKKTGIFVSIDRLSKNVKVQKYSGKIRLNSNKWASGIDVKLTVNVKKGNPKLTVTPSSITLNEMSPKMLAKTKVALDRENVRMLPFEEWKIELFDSEKRLIPNDLTDDKRWFDYSYKDGYLYVEYHYKEKFVYSDEAPDSDPYVAPERRPYPGNYKLKISNVFESTDLSKEIALKIIEKDPVVTFKPSGSIDLVNRVNSNLVETITLKNTEGKLKKISLVTEGHDYLNNFIINVLSEDSFMVTMKPDAVARVNSPISIKGGIDFYVNIELQNEDTLLADGTRIENTTVLENVKFNYKPKQSSPKIKLEKVEIKKNERILLDLQSFMPSGVVIMDTSLAKEIDGIAVTTGKNDMASLKRAGVLISVDDTMDPGSKATIRVDCTLLGAEETGTDEEGNPISKPITINIPVSVVE